MQLLLVDLLCKIISRLPPKSLLTSAIGYTLSD